MKSIQETIIKDILKWDNLNAERRGKMLRDLVQKGDLSDISVGSFLYVTMRNSDEATKKTMDKIISGFYGVEPKNEVNEHQSERLTPHSPSDWSKKELQYYKIEMEACTKIEEMFILEKMDQHAAEFVEKHKDVSYIDMTYAKAVEESIDDFNRMLFYVFREDKIEAHVDNLMMLLLRGILPRDKFLVFNNYPFDFFVGGDKRRSIPDVAALFIPKALVGMIVIEDKASGAADLKPENAEAQAIAEAIAVCQQEKWEENHPIFFLRTIGYNLTFYKAIFSKEFLKDVELGKERKTQTKVRKLVDGKGPGADLFSLLNPQNRELACQILYSIACEITKAFNNK